MEFAYNTNKKVVKFGDIKYFLYLCISIQKYTTFRTTMCIVPNCNTKSDKPRCYKHQLMHQYGDAIGMKKFKRYFERMAKRKEKRKENNYCNRGTWIDDNGRMMQNCDYFGTCEFPCNGDC